MMRWRYNKSITTIEIISLVNAAAARNITRLDCLYIAKVRYCIIAGLGGVFSVYSYNAVNVLAPNLASTKLQHGLPILLLLARGYLRFSRFHRFITVK